MNKLFLILLLCFSNMFAHAYQEKWDDHKSGWSSLMIAIYKHITGRYHRLIQKGADVNFVSSGRKTNWKITALEVAIRTNNSDAVKALLETNEIIHPENLIFVAAAYENALNIELLIKYGANPNDTSGYGYSVLMMAASFGSPEVMSTLIKYGAQVNQATINFGLTPLMYAAMSGSLVKVNLLLDANADKNLKDTNGHTAHYYVDMIHGDSHIDEKTIATLKELLK